MNYNENLQSSNTKLEGILNTINNLPSAGPAEDLSTELTEQDALLTELKTVLEGKAAGSGGTIETCTLTMDFSKMTTGTLIEWIMVICENGRYTIEICNNHTDLYGVHTFSNVLLLSTIVFTAGGIGTSVIISSFEGCEKLDFQTYLATEKSCRIEFEPNNHVGGGE